MALSIADPKVWLSNRLHGLLLLALEEIRLKLSSPARTWSRILTPEDKIDVVPTDIRTQNVGFQKNHSLSLKYSSYCTTIKYGYSKGSMESVFFTLRLESPCSSIFVHVKVTLSRLLQV